MPNSDKAGNDLRDWPQRLGWQGFSPCRFGVARTPCRAFSCQVRVVMVQFNVRGAPLWRVIVYASCP